MGQLFSAVESHFQLPRVRLLGMTQQVGVESRFAGIVEDHRDEQRLSVVQRDAELAAVGTDHHVLHHPFPQVANRFRDPPQILDMRDRHARITKYAA